MAADPREDDLPSKPPVWNDPRIRALVFQIVIVVAVSAFGYYLFDNTLTNLQKRGITTGFGFLDSQASFGIIQTLVEYSETSTYGRTFIVGLLNTLLVSGLGIALATLLGFVIGIARLSSNWLIAKLAAVYVELFRNIPLLLQIFFWYFAVLRTLPSPRESYDLGGAVFLNLTKNSSLATAIGYPDLVSVFAGTTLNQTGQAVEVIAMTMGVYLTISLVISLLMNWYNKRKTLVER
jgi:general L-amino acid transport system permease protein